jgi:uncharacterized protein YwgA
MDSIDNYVTENKELDLTIPDAVLYVLHIAGDKMNEIKLEKMIYLIQKKVINLHLSFDRFHYGPSSSQFRKYIRVLCVSNEIKEKPSGLLIHEYKLTTLGKAVAQSIEKEIKPDIKEKIEQIVKTWKNAPNSKIIEHTTPLWYEERNLY